MNILGKIDNKQNIELKIDGKMEQIKDIFVFVKGDIFNKDEMLKKYNLDGCSNEIFVTKLYEKDGLNFFSFLDGNFCVVIYDNKKNKLYLIKDKLGTIPLFYYYKDNTFIFSTSLKEITKEKEFNKQINIQALSNYLGYMFIYEPYTIYENTYKLEKGTILEYNNNVITKNKYYNLYKVCKDIKEDKQKNEEEQIKDLQELFEKSIKKLGDKESQVGVFMSGGKDSTFLAKIASNYFTKKINTYTLGFYDVRDESNRAKKIADYIGTNHHTIMIPNESVIEIVKKSVKIYEEPFADPSIIPNIYMIENINDKNDFYITGEGNDAIFASSNIYDILKPKGFFKIMKENLIKIINGMRIPKTIDELFQINIIRRFTFSDLLVKKKGKIYPSEIVKNNVRRTVIGYLNNIVSEKYREKTGALARYHNYKYFTPFYDVDIIEKTFSIPLDLIIKDGKGKYIFEKILYNNIDKSMYSDYKKVGFGIPLVKWMNEFMLEKIKKITEKEFINSQCIFDYNELIKLINEFEKKQTYSIAVVLWNYYVFQLWYKENI